MVLPIFPTCHVGILLTTGMSVDDARTGTVSPVRYTWTLTGDDTGSSVKHVACVEWRYGTLGIMRPTAATGLSSRYLNVHTHRS